MFLKPIHPIEEFRPMSRYLRFLCIFFLVVSPCAAQQKKRVAVLNFDYGTVRTVVASIFGTDQDVGKGISDLLVQKLVQDGKYSVIERNAIDKVLAEQNFSNSDRADASTAAKIGHILGVDAIIMGSITKFGRDDKKVGGVGGGRGGWTGAIAGFGKKDSKAEVAITARLVNTSTGEILAAVTGNGQSSRSGLFLGGAGGGPGGAGGGAFDMSSSNFAETILGEAVTKAVDDTATQLDGAAANLPTVKVVINGLVADVSGNSLILNVGSKAGVKVGDKLDISRPVRTVKDPATGKVLKTVTNKLGEATVTEVDADSCTATFAGSAPPKIGDVAANNP
jgi:curli biogenesis system outer membrane secretion channel CsgG